MMVDQSSFDDMRSQEEEMIRISSNIILQIILSITYLFAANKSMMMMMMMMTMVIVAIKVSMIAITTMLTRTCT